MSTRRRAIADEIGSANVVIAADAYRQGWCDALAAARRALTPEERSVPTPADALRAWLTEGTSRLRLSWRAEETVIAVWTAENTATEENPS